ncbi:hypothetical protein LNP05_21500 [Klebsiella pneumoniae subsp. pneumoniae]|nr:hypothetical protein [Klebsiella pneumoniae subsp. pneumoniae]
MAPPPSGAGALHVRYSGEYSGSSLRKVSQALIAAGAPLIANPRVRQSAKVQFGDYQANGVMAVAKKLGMAPRQLAEQVLSSSLTSTALPTRFEIAGPGFINIFPRPARFWRTTSTARCSLSAWASRNRRRRLSSSTTRHPT